MQGLTKQTHNLAPVFINEMKPLVIAKRRSLAFGYDDEVRLDLRL